MKAMIRTWAAVLWEGLVGRGRCVDCKISTLPRPTGKLNLLALKRFSLRGRGEMSKKSMKKMTWENKAEGYGRLGESEASKDLRNGNSRGSL